VPSGCIIATMRIGELAKQAGVNVQTIRFYERRQLLREPQRLPSGYRNYDGGDLENVVFIKWCQQLGFTLKEIRQLLQLHSAVAHLPPARLKADSAELIGIVKMAEEKLATIQAKIKLLQTMEHQVLSTICKLQRTPAPGCPAGTPAIRIERDTK
jgi:MerR family mercuric resistance operon transcriptional regulator